LKKKKDDSEIIDDADHEPPVRLYKISVKDKKITRLTANTDWIESWSVSKDGKYAAASHAKSLHYQFDQKVPPIAVLHNLSDGTEKADFHGRARAALWFRVGSRWLRILCDRSLFDRSEIPDCDDSKRLFLRYGLGQVRRNSSGLGKTASGLGLSTRLAGLLPTWRRAVIRSWRATPRRKSGSGADVAQAISYGRACEEYSRVRLERRRKKRSSTTIRRRASCRKFTARNSMARKSFRRCKSRN